MTERQLKAMVHISIDIRFSALCAALTTAAG
jgi:hypothetical protein